MEEITSESKVDEVLKMTPKMAKIFKEYGLSCPGCHGIAQDTIAHVAINNGLNINDFLESLNKGLS